MPAQNILIFGTITFVTPSTMGISSLSIVVEDTTADILTKALPSEKTKHSAHTLRLLLLVGE
jgi:hypothetical protein